MRRASLARKPVLTLALGAALGCTALGSAAPALAEQAAEPQPPGIGMIDQPCPDQTKLWFGSPYLHAYDWAWLCRYRADNARIAASAPPDVVFMGDSITEGWVRLDPEFFAHGHAGRGISAQTTPQMLARFYQDVIALRPRIVHIMAGTNNVAGNTGPTDAEAFRNDIRAMADLADAHHIAVIIGSILPADRLGWRPEVKPVPLIAGLNMWLREFAASRGYVYADYYAAMVGKGGALPPELSRDGVHPEAAGYALMRPVAERAIAETEARLAATRRRR